LFLLAGWAILSLVGFWGRNGIYRNYTCDVRTTPYFALVLEGAHDGVYPWNAPWSADQNQGEDLALDATEEIAIAETETEELPCKPGFVTVDESYFDDAVFIGDSRTEGLRDYGGLDGATFYAATGLNIFDMWDQKFCDVEDEKVTLEEALSTRQFGKLYFQIGINEMGRGTVDSFIRAYEQSIEKFEELQPNAVIYIQGIMHVTKEKSDSDEIFNNPGIEERNDRIKELADGERVFYIDMNEAVCDRDGNLRDNLTFDDLHLYASKYGIWVRFLLSKGLEIYNR
jgi:hypothetical protein